MPADQLFVFTAGNREARAALEQSIINTVDVRRVFPNVFPGLREKLGIAARSGGIFAWGVVPGPNNERNWAAMRRADWVLCVYDSTYHFVTQVVDTFDSAGFASAVWGRDEDGQTRQFVYLLTRPRKINVSVEALSSYLNDAYMGFSRISDEKIARIRLECGSIDKFINSRLLNGSRPNSTQTPVYLLLHADGSLFRNDEIGRKYYFSSNTPNYKKLVDGAQVVIDRKAPDGVRVIGYGELEPPTAISGDIGRDTKFTAPFKTWVPYTPAREVPSTLRLLIQTRPGYNAQHTICLIDKEIYEELIRLPMPKPKLTERPLPLEPTVLRSPAAPPPTVSVYTIEDALKELFLERHELESIQNGLKRKKNIILEGPPGVGKTFAARRIAWITLGAVDPSRHKTVQFHQSYTYEDFVKGWRSNGIGGFYLKNGIFYNFCKLAGKNLSQPYVFVVDEINRGDVSRIFGELITLIESDKRGREFQIPLVNSDDSDERFSVPENVFLIGIANTADRSLAMVDYALRRRFAFVKLSPKFDSSRFASNLQERGATSELVERIVSRFGVLNDKIRRDPRLGAGFCIGHSHFCHLDGVNPTLSWYHDVIETDIAPLIREYWFADEDVAESLIAELRD